MFMWGDVKEQYKLEQKNTRNFGSGYEGKSSVADHTMDQLE